MTINKVRHTSKTLIITRGILIGGFLGMLIGSLNKTGILIIPGLSSTSFNEIIGGTLLGTIIGGLIGVVLALYFTQKISANYGPDKSTNNEFQLKEEQLHIAKKWIETGEVNIYRDNITVDKSFTVPVKQEALVIEKKVLSKTTDHKDVPTEVIRILLREEQVEFSKHMVALQDVSIHKDQIEEIKHIEESLKREKLKVQTSESLKVRKKSYSK